MFPVLGGKLKKCPRDKTQRAAGAQRRKHAFLRTQVARMAKAKQRFTPDADGSLSHNGLSIGSPGLMGLPHSVGTASSSHSVAFIGMVAHQATPLHIPWGCISRSRKREEERGSWGLLDVTIIANSAPAHRPLTRTHPMAMPSHGGSLFQGVRCPAETPRFCF